MQRSGYRPKIPLLIPGSLLDSGPRDRSLTADRLRNKTWWLKESFFWKIQVNGG